jgi:hypothetical protein
MNSRRLIAAPKALGKALSVSTLNVGAPEDTCGRHSPERQDKFAPARRIHCSLSNDRVSDTVEFTTHLTTLCELDHVGLEVGVRYIWLKGPFRVQTVVSASK